MQRDRIWELDAFRGICILCVIVIHFVFDLSYFLGLHLGLPRAYYFVQENGGVLFILLSGICATLGSRSFRRGLIVFLCGMLITLVTFAMARLGMAGEDLIIHFGVLHLLGVSMMLYPALKKLPTWALTFLGAAIVIAGYLLLARTFAVPGLFIFGIRTPDYNPGDYFPLLPFLGWFCLGIVLGRTLYREKKSLLPGAPKDARILRFFRFCGRHSLWIYLAHQPICYGLIELISRL